MRSSLALDDDVVVHSHPAAYIYQLYNSQPFASMSLFFGVFVAARVEGKVSRVASTSPSLRVRRATCSISLRALRPGRNWANALMPNVIIHVLSTQTKNYIAQKTAYYTNTDSGTETHK